MNANKLKTILDNHGKWWRGKADGERADLSGADLSGAYLRWADLSEADLSGANLRGANLRGARFLELRTDVWTVQVHANTVRIGRQHHTHKAWLAFTDEQIDAMDHQALAWCRVYKPVVAGMIEAVKQQ